MSAFLKNIFKNVNTSSLLIMPIYQYFIKTGTYKNTKVNYPFIQCCFDNGFINSFLYRNNKKDIKSIYLVFDKSSVTKKPEWGENEYSSINELLISSSYFISLEIFNDLIIYKLKIPEEFIKDVILITKSKYSATSSKYKNKMNLPTKYVKKNSSEIGYYIVENNLSKAVLYKSYLIKQILEDFFGDSVDSPELWSNFETNKETLTNTLLKNLLNFKKIC